VLLARVQRDDVRRPDFVPPERRDLSDVVRLLLGQLHSRDLHLAVRSGPLSVRQQLGLLLGELRHESVHLSGAGEE
jgi:hypothetical protein